MYTIDDDCLVQGSKEIRAFVAKTASSTTISRREKEMLKAMF